MDVIGLKKTLQELKQNRNKTRIVSFTGMIDNCIAKVEKTEEELRRSQLDATQLAQVPVTTLKQVEDIMNVTNAQTALSSTEEQIKTVLAQIEKTNEIQNVAMSDGEMQVAEGVCSSACTSNLLLKLLKLKLLLSITRQLVSSWYRVHGLVLEQCSCLGKKPLLLEPLLGFRRALGSKQLVRRQHPSVVTNVSRSSSLLFFAVRCATLGCYLRTLAFALLGQSQFLCV